MGILEDTIRTFSPVLADALEGNVRRAGSENNTGANQPSTLIAEIPVNPGDLPDVTGRFTGNFEMSVALNLIDSMNVPPPRITEDYLEILRRTLTFLETGSELIPLNLTRQTGARPVWSGNSYPEKIQSSTGGGSVFDVTGPGLDSEEKVRNAVNMARNSIFEVINRINSFVARARNAGFKPPDNPFAAAMSYNIGRMGFSPVNLDAENASAIVSNVRTYVKLLKAEKSGQLNLDRNVNKAAQLSSATLSLEGFGGTGNTSVDLAKLLPDADEVKAQKAFEALSVFDFTKRVPKVLFTAFYAPEGVPKGVIVGWRKVADASGYVIKRTSLFDGKQTTYTVTNENIQRDTLRLKEYVKAWILSFYDNIQHEFVLTFMDSDVPPHGYFHYRVQAYQLQNEVPGTTFNVEASPIFLSAPQKRSIRNQLEKLDPNIDPILGNSDTISPYPVLAHVLLGDAKYDWLMAAVNVRQSINRNDPRTTTRKYSYLSAQLDFLFSQADAGMLMVPKGKDVSTVLKNIEGAIAKYGVTQVIKDVLQETGALYHFEGKDPNDSALFRNVDTSDQADSGLVTVVASALDPETATLDLRALASNLPLLLSGEFVDIKKQLSKGVFNLGKKYQPSELEVPAEFDGSNSEKAEDEIQYLSKLGNLDDGIVDLTTAEGIGTFMRTIRIFSDIGPNRGAPIVSTPATFSPDPVKVAPRPPPGGKGPSQPIEPPFMETATTHVDEPDIAPAKFINRKDQFITVKEPDKRKKNK